MGTDITLIVEEKVDGAWVARRPYREYLVDLGQGYEVFEPKWWLQRNYALFSKLAGVRECEGYTQIAEQRGLPQDATKEAVKLLEDGGGYGMTWYSLQELLDHKDWGKYCEDFYSLLLQMKEAHSGEIRLILWFDC